MKTVNALEIRNHLGGILEELRKKKEPILVSKGRKIEAVLITPEDFKVRFLDRQAEDERRKLMEKIRSLRGPAKEESLAVLRALRGYSE